MTRKEFYKTKAWERCRMDYLALDKSHGFCERCLKSGEFNAGVIVHHKMHLTDENYANPAVSLDLDNLELVCQKCHNQEHHGTGKRRYMFSEDGSLTIISD